MKAIPLPFHMWQDELGKHSPGNEEEEKVTELVSIGFHKKSSWDVQTELKLTHPHIFTGSATPSTPATSHRPRFLSAQAYYSRRGTTFSLTALVYDCLICATSVDGCFACCSATGPCLSFASTDQDWPDKRRWGRAVCKLNSAEREDAAPGALKPQAGAWVDGVPALSRLPPRYSLSSTRTEKRPSRLS